MSSHSTATINFQASNHPLAYNTAVSQNLGYNTGNNNKVNYNPSLAHADQDMSTADTQGIMDSSSTAVTGSLGAPRRGKL